MTRKEIEFRLKQLDKELPILENEVATAQRKLAGLKAEMLELTLKLNKPKEGITVSDHALIRYLERKFKLDVESLKKEILTPEREAAIKMGATKIKAEGIDFVVKNNTIVTSV